jgi:hypothetical protein
MDLNALLNPGTLALLIPVLGMVGWIVSEIAKHRERMARIEKGIDPNGYKRLEKPRE